MKIESVSLIELGVWAAVFIAIVAFALVLTVAFIASRIGPAFQKYRDSRNLKINVPGDMDELSKMWEGQSSAK